MNRKMKALLSLLILVLIGNNIYKAHHSWKAHAEAIYLATALFTLVTLSIAVYLHKNPLKSERLFNHNLGGLRMKIAVWAGLLVLAAVPFIYQQLNFKQGVWVFSAKYHPEWAQTPEQSAENFIDSAVERGAGAPGTASCTCDMQTGAFVGTFTWSQNGAQQTFQGYITGQPGNWSMSQIQLSKPE